MWLGVLRIGSQIKNNAKPNRSIASKPSKRNSDYEEKNDLRPFGPNRRDLRSDNKYLATRFPYINKSLRELIKSRLTTKALMVKKPKEVSTQIHDEKRRIWSQNLQHDSVQGNPVFNKQSPWTYQNLWAQKNQNQDQQKRLQFKPPQKNQNQQIKTIRRQQYQNLQNPNQQNQFVTPNQYYYQPNLENQAGQFDPERKNQYPNRQNVYSSQFKKQDQDFSKQGLSFNSRNKVSYPSGKFRPSSNSNTQNQVRFHQVNQNPSYQNLYQQNQNPNKQSQFYGRQGQNVTPQDQPLYPLNQNPNQLYQPENPSGLNFNPPNQNPNQLNPPGLHLNPPNQYPNQQYQPENPSGLHFNSPNQYPNQQYQPENPSGLNFNPQNQIPNQLNQPQNPSGLHFNPPNQNPNQLNQPENPSGLHFNPPNQYPNQQHQPENPSGLHFNPPNQNPNQLNPPQNPSGLHFNPSNQIPNPQTQSPSQQNPPQNFYPNQQNPNLNQQTPNPNPQTPNPNHQTPNTNPQTQTPYQQTLKTNPQTPTPNQQTPTPNQQTSTPKQQTPNPNPQTQNLNQQNPNEVQQHQQSPIPPPGSTIQVTSTQSQDQSSQVTTEESQQGITTAKPFFDYADIPGWLEEATATIPEVTDVVPNSATEFDYAAILPDADKGDKTDVKKHHVIESAELGMMKYQIGFMLGFFHELLTIMDQVNKKGSTHDLYVALKQYIEKLLREGTLIEMGHSVQKAMQYSLILLVDWTPDEVQGRIELGLYTIEHQDVALTVEVKTVLEQLDHSYSLEEGRLLLNTLIDVYDFTQTYNDTGHIDQDNSGMNMTEANVTEINAAHGVVKKIVDALLVPFWDAFPANRHRLFDKINSLIEERYMAEITGQKPTDIQRRAFDKNEIQFDNVDGTKIGRYYDGIIRTGAANMRAMNFDVSFDKPFLVSNDNKRKEKKNVYKAVYDKSKSSKSAKRKKIIIGSTTQISKEPYKYDRFEEQSYTYEKTLRQKLKKHGFYNVKGFTESTKRINKHANKKYVTIKSKALEINKKRNKISYKTSKERNSLVTEQDDDKSTESNDYDVTSISIASKEIDGIPNKDLKKQNFIDTFEERVETDVENDVNLKKYAKFHKINKSNLHAHDFKPSIGINFDNNIEKEIKYGEKKVRTQPKSNAKINKSKLYKNDYNPTTVPNSDYSFEKDKKQTVNIKSNEEINKIQNNDREITKKGTNLRTFNKTDNNMQIDVETRNIKEDSSLNKSSLSAEFNPEHSKRSLSKVNTKSNKLLIKNDVNIEVKRVKKNYLDRSNETDEENEFKIRLSDALRHSDFDYKKFRRSNNLFHTKRNMFEQSSFSDEEATLKRNIYKVFG